MLHYGFLNASFAKRRMLLSATLFLSLRPYCIRRIVVASASDSIAPIFPFSMLHMLRIIHNK